MGIKDPYVQTMLLVGVKRLQAGEGGAAGELRPGHPPAGHSASEHQLRPDSFCALQPCHLCGLYLLGTDHQGLHCPGTRRHGTGRDGTGRDGTGREEVWMGVVCREEVEAV